MSGWPPLSPLWRSGFTLSEATRRSSTGSKISRRVPSPMISRGGHCSHSLMLIITLHWWATTGSTQSSQSSHRPGPRIHTASRVVRVYTTRRKENPTKSAHRMFSLELSLLSCPQALATARRLEWPSAERFMSYPSINDRDGIACHRLRKVAPNPAPMSSRSVPMEPDIYRQETASI